MSSEYYVNEFGFKVRRKAKIEPPKPVTKDEVVSTVQSVLAPTLAEVKAEIEAERASLMKMIAGKLTAEQSPPVTAEPPPEKVAGAREWEFDFERNLDGSLKRIVARRVK